MTEEAPATVSRRNKDVPRDLQPYVLCLLLKGDRWNDTQGDDAEGLMHSHLAFLREQMEAGRYRLAGPVMDDPRMAGVVVVAAKTVEAALAIANADPGVRAGRLAIEAYLVLLPSLEGLKVRFD